MSTDNVTFSYTIRKLRTLYCLLPYIQGFYFKKHKKELKRTLLFGSIISVVGKSSMEIMEPF
ncbi:protein of unknown function [Streptococcus thermophilus]|nr:protein of unknown function [Streptococcus thermophilus]